MDKIFEKLSSITDEKNIFCNEPMKNHTTFRTGGIADYLVLPASKEELKECLKLNMPRTIIGNGSNLLVKDGGIRGLVIQTTRLNTITVDGTVIEAESGCFLSKIANVAKDYSLTGFEFASGIPGTLGGAVLMNAGAYGSEMKDVIIETEYMDQAGVVHTLTDIPSHEFDYRKSFFTNKDLFILSSKIRLEKGNQEEIIQKMKELQAKRVEKQPLKYPSAGSTFKRSDGYFAGKLIEDAGLKGYSIGDAMVSDLHAGFVINKGNASSKDILKLIHHIQQVVKEKFGVSLETEIKIIGEDKVS